MKFMRLLEDVIFSILFIFTYLLIESTFNGLFLSLLIFFFFFFLLNYVQYKATSNIDLGRREQTVHYKLSKVGYANLKIVRSFLKNKGYNKGFYLQVDDSDNSINGAFHRKWFYRDGKKIDLHIITITTGSLNRLTSFGVLSLLGHEIGHYINKDCDFTLALQKYLTFCGFGFLGNILSRYNEFRADTYSYKLFGNKVLQLILIQKLHECRDLDIKHIQRLRTHPNWEQRIMFYKKKYSLDIETIWRIICPLSIRSDYSSIVKYNKKVKCTINSAI